MIKMIDDHGMVTTPMLQPYPEDGNKEDVRALMGQEDTLGMLLFARTGVLALHCKLGCKHLDLNFGKGTCVYSALSDAMSGYIVSEKYARELRKISKVNREQAEALEYLVWSGVTSLMELGYIDLSDQEHNSLLYDEGIRQLHSVKKHNMPNIGKGLDLILKSYLIEQIDFKSIILCQGSYLDACNERLGRLQ